MGSEGLHTVILLTGSNLGVRENNLEAASAYVEKTIGKLKKSSSLYESEPWGNKDQPSYINQALMVVTSLLPKELLNAIHTIEHAMGRVRNHKWEARIIDIDILFYDDLVFTAPGLKIPHPEFINRTFAILPVIEISADHVHPQNHLTMRQVLELCKDKGNVTKMKSHVS